ncbi:hypothetical protein [Solibacillus cecembensis]|uniref:hypothetical protein n=1 Tax=Solibacillus cecembensis TaxID=459347 RepID=UPI003D069CA8
MAEKVKVSREVAEEIERIRALYDNDKEYLILSAATGFLTRNYKTLKHLKGHEVAEIFISGYKIVETPEEQVVAYYNEIKSHIEYSKSKGERNKAGEDAMKIIEDITGILGCKIKGINE